jgi:hypothetical protein
VGECLAVCCDGKCLPDASRKGNYIYSYELAYRVEQDVGGLEVAVDHLRVSVVEEGEALGRADGDLHPRHPWEGAVGTCSDKDVSCEYLLPPRH